MRCTTMKTNNIYALTVESYVYNTIKQLFKCEFQKCGQYMTHDYVWWSFLTFIVFSLLFRFFLSFLSNLVSCE